MNRRARNRFGQNFLTDSHVIRQITDTIAARSGQLLIEIGPGRAAITRALLDCGVDLIVVEIDRDLVRDLEARFEGHPHLQIHNLDALKTDFGSLALGREYRLVGNLPYNISTPLLFHILELHQPPVDMYFMLQKEVVKRMAAVPGGRDYGRLSIMCQNRCEVSPLFEIRPGAFDPKPKVDSSFVRLVPRATPLSGIELQPQLDQVVRKAFSLRRKTLRNSLRGLLETTQIEAAGVDPGQRAEQLSIDQFVTLAGRLKKGLR